MSILWWVGSFLTVSAVFACFLFLLMAVVVNLYESIKGKHYHDIGIYGVLTLVILYILNHASSAWVRILEAGVDHVNF